MSDPRVVGLPSANSTERMVNLESAGILRFSDRKRGTNPKIAFAREGVAHLLAEAAAALPDGIALLGIEAYRPPELQSLYYDSYQAKLRGAHPELSRAELDALTSRFVAPPEVAPHPSGAAIDLTLCTDEGWELDLGSAVDATPEVSQGACYTNAVGLTAEAARNRRLLVGTLSAVGLVNYPTEWWHWSFGDRYWAMATGASAAHYGIVTE